jgi:hypothetical protein
MRATVNTQNLFRNPKKHGNSSCSMKLSKAPLVIPGVFPEFRLRLERANRRFYHYVSRESASPAVPLGFGADLPRASPLCQANGPRVSSLMASTASRSIVRARDGGRGSPQPFIGDAASRKTGCADGSPCFLWTAHGRSGIWSPRNQTLSLIYFENQV